MKIQAKLLPPYFIVLCLVLVAQRHAFASARNYPQVRVSPSKRDFSSEVIE